MAEAAQKVKYQGLWRKGKKIGEEGRVRIDNQGVVTKPFPGFNIQAQIGGETFAAVRISDAVAAACAANQVAEDEVLAEVAAALQFSATSGNWQDIDWA
jgi:hypothetical protein